MLIFESRTFKEQVRETYQNPLAAEPSWLCLLNLVFANGLKLRHSAPHNGKSNEHIIDRLNVNCLDRSEIFYLNAKHLNDPVSGFEDGGFSSVQALLLMTLYMLTAAKRNAAWAYFGIFLTLLFDVLRNLLTLTTNVKVWLYGWHSLWDFIRKKPYCYLTKPIRC
jgi:hypothetical protein